MTVEATAAHTREPMPAKSKPSRKLGSLLFEGTSTGFAILALVLLAGIIVALTIASWPSIRAFGFDFLTSSEWNPPAERFGALIPIYGTVVSSIIALVIEIGRASCRKRV